MTVPRHVTRPQPKSHNKPPPQPKDCTKTATSHYLTPPLTPSSSLQSDTTDHDTTDISTDLRRPTRSSPKGNQCSRFLIVSNISRITCVESRSCNVSCRLETHPAICPRIPSDNISPLSLPPVHGLLRLLHADFPPSQYSPHSVKVQMIGIL